jgi:hypothetical protein
MEEAGSGHEDSSPGTATNAGRLAGCLDSQASPWVVNVHADTADIARSTLLHMLLPCSSTRLPWPFAVKSGEGKLFEDSLRRDAQCAPPPTWLKARVCRTVSYIPPCQHGTRRTLHHVYCRWERRIRELYRRCAVRVIAVSHIVVAEQPTPAVSTF